jgi:hypothetical protein
MADWLCLNSPTNQKAFTEKSPNKIGNLHTMRKENETGVKTGKITPYRIFGWVPLALFFIGAGTTALIMILKSL